MWFAVSRIRTCCPAWSGGNSLLLNLPSCVVISFRLLSSCSLRSSFPTSDLLGMHVVTGLPNMISAGEGGCRSIGVALMLRQPLFTSWPERSIFFSRGLMCCTARSARPLLLGYRGCVFNSP